MQNNVELMRVAYDRIVADYDSRWSVHVAEPQRRLTRELRLLPGDRCADLGCGTGIDTLELLKLATPGEVVAVDCSPGMLDTARTRAQTAGFPLTTRCEGADEFIAHAEAASFDVISLRFCLGYLDWRTALPRAARLLRAGGRIGILTILANSAPQAYTTYKHMVSELGLPDVPLTALTSLDPITERLAAGGTVIESAWQHDFRLEFESGEQLASWLQTSGIATSPALPGIPTAAVQALWRSFAERLEAFREGDIVPLDFHLAGVVASLPELAGHA
ncbi:MAG TPA: methyltransferase domain-containing protein [Polyangiales bacterium]|nr:methyltransferase domain-containing protein [Polyangiales bacterium]